MIKSMLFSGALASMVYGYQELKPRPVEQVIVEIPESQKNFNEYLRDSARVYGIPESIAVAMVYQESRGQRNAIRFEPSQLKRAEAVSRASGEQLRMYASSHCQMQIMGYHAPKYGLTWSDLYDQKTCAELGMKIMADCMARHKEKKPIDKVKGALTCYNGSEEYARAILNRIGQKLLEVHLESELKG